MKWVKHDIGEWTAMTQSLSATEEGMLMRLLNWQYANEAALPDDPEDLRRITRAEGRAEAFAAGRVLKQHFVETDLGLVHQKAWSLMVEAGRFDDKPDLAGVTLRYSERDTALPLPSNAESRLVSRSVTSNKARQRAFRARKSGIFTALSERGIFPAADASMRELLDLCAKHDIASEVAGQSNAEVTQASRPRTRPEFNTRPPVTNTGDQGERMGALSRYAAVTPPAANGHAALTPADVGKALIAAGIDKMTINLGNPKLLALIEAGCTLDEFTGAASSALQKGKGTYPYVLAVVDGLRREQQAAGPIPARQDLMSIWAPSMAAKLKGAP